MNNITSQIDQLAAQANAAHRAAQVAVAGALEYARQAGEALNRAKAEIPHGQWATWLTEHVEFSERTARGYMRLAREWPSLQRKIGNAVADLSLRSALRCLAAPRTVEDYLPFSRITFDQHGAFYTVLDDDRMVWITPSFKYPGYYYLEKCVVSSGEIEGMRRPAKEEFIRFCVEQDSDLRSALWKRCPPAFGPEDAHQAFAVKLAETGNFSGQDGTT